MALSISCWSLLSHSSEMRCLSSVNTGYLESINPVLHNPPDLVISHIPLNVHSFSRKSLIIWCAPKCLVFCKIELNVYLLQKTSLLSFLQKHHNCVTAQRVINRFCQTQITVSWHIHLRIFAESFIKFVQKLREVYRKTNVSLFSEHGVDTSQGSVAMYLRRGGIFKYEFVANLLLSLLAKEFWKSVNIWRSYGARF